MLRILIADDRQLFRKRVKRILNEMPDLQIVESAGAPMPRRRRRSMGLTPSWDGTNPFGHGPYAHSGDDKRFRRGYCTSGLMPP